MILLSSYLGYLGELALKTAHGFAVDEYLGQAVVHKDIHVNRIIIKCTVATHTVEEGLQLPRMARICLADTQGKHGLECRVTES